jgi:hypothetical protein
MSLLARVAHSLLPLTIALPGWAFTDAGATAAEGPTAATAPSAPSAPAAGETGAPMSLAAANPTRVAPSAATVADHVVASDSGTPSADATSATKAVDGFGTALAASDLDRYRGGQLTLNTMQLTGALTNTYAADVATGSNSINEGSFANASGLPTVIQNSGANVLIQNATILNVRFGN